MLAQIMQFTNERETLKKTLRLLQSMNASKHYQDWIRGKMNDYNKMISDAVEKAVKGSNG